MKPTVLVFVGRYLPGYKGGGPIRSLANLVDHLGNELDFRIVTSDRDGLDKQPYSNVMVDEWNRVGNALVYYCSPKNRSLNTFRKLINDTPHDVLYFNSFFNPTFTLKPLLLRRVGLIPDRPVLLAPRGEFSPDAQKLKRWKKLPYQLLVRTIGLYQGITWQATSAQEARDIRRVLRGLAANVVVAPNLPGIQLDTEPVPVDRGPRQQLRVLFLSRVSPMKNLEFALNVLSKVSANIEFSIFGPIADTKYWARCEEAIRRLPPNVSATYYGPVKHSDVPRIMASHDLFFLPTLGENYGHAIIEALSAGTPVLISDRTPWRDLSRAGVGYDLPLESADAFVKCIDEVAKMSPEAYADWRKRARQYARNHGFRMEVVNANRDIFLNLIGRFAEAQRRLP